MVSSDGDALGSGGAQTLKDPVIVVHYVPEDEFNIWMYMMIFIGCAFVLFVIASVYLMCKSPRRPVQEPPTPLRRGTVMTSRSGGRGKDSKC